MAHTYQELKKKTVAQLREIAAGMDHEALKGHTQLNKEHLIKALCTALNIDTFEHHEVVGIDKKSIKNQIRDLKRQRDEAIAAKKKSELKHIRRKIHDLKKILRKSAV